MTAKINTKITTSRIKDNAEYIGEQTMAISLNESITRPDKLEGRTYKLSVPDHVSKHSLYVTINNITLNEGTNQEEVRPFEIFITSKSMAHFEWIVALTRLMSAVFRKGGDCLFVIEELHSVFNPQGGYFSKGGYKNSVINEIGDIMQRHFVETGIVEEGNKQAGQVVRPLAPPEESIEKPLGAECPNCGSYTLIPSEGCSKCISCDYSACS